MADANFAASPPKPSALGLNHGLYETQNENVGTFSYHNKPQTLNNRNFAQVSATLEPSLNNDVNINKQVIIESEEHPPSSVWQKSKVAVHSDEKPDLLEYNSKTADSDLNYVEIHNQLPDITSSVRGSSHSVNSNAVDNLSNSLDLISAANGTLLTELSGVEDKHENDLISSYSAIEENRLVEDVHNICETNVLSSSCYGTRRDTNEADNEHNPVDVREVNLCRLDENYGENNKDGCNPMNEVNLDVNESNEGDDNRIEGSKKLAETPKENAENTEDKLEECSNICDTLSGNLQQKIICFNNDEEYSQSQLLEYLEEVDKEFEGAVIQDVPFTEEILGVPNESEVEINNTNRTMKIKNQIVNDSSLTATDDQNENILDLSNIKLLSVNSLQSISLHDKHLSIQNSLQNIQDKNKSYQSSSIPRGMDCRSNVETSNFGQIEYSEKCSAITVDYKHELEESVKEHKTIAGGLNQTDSSSRTNQVDELCTRNPFEQSTSDGNVTELDLKTRTSNPFECDSTNPFDDDDDSVNPFENSCGNPFEDNSKSELEDGGSDPQSVLQKTVHTVNSVESSSKNATSNNDSAFEKATICDSANDNSESILRTNSTVVTETVGTVSNLSENSNSSMCGVDSRTERSFETIKTENVNMPEENSSTDYSPSGSSLDSESFNSALMGSAKMIPIKQAVESASGGLHHIDEAGTPAEEDKPVRPNSLELPQRITVESSTSEASETGLLNSYCSNIGFIRFFVI